MSQFFTWYNLDEENLVQQTEYDIRTKVCKARILKCNWPYRTEPLDENQLQPARMSLSACACKKEWKSNQPNISPVMISQCNVATVLKTVRETICMPCEELFAALLFLFWELLMDSERRYKTASGPQQRMLTFQDIRVPKNSAFALSTLYTCSRCSHHQHEVSTCSSGSSLPCYRQPVGRTWTWAWASKAIAERGHQRA